MKTILILFLVTACATSAKRVNDVSLGMHKNEVLNTLGEPTYTRAKGDETILMYEMSDKQKNPIIRGMIAVVTLGFSEMNSYIEEYEFVFDNRNKLVVYGRSGDYVKPREPQKLIIEQDTKIKQEISINKEEDPKRDVATDSDKAK